MIRATLLLVNSVFIVEELWQGRLELLGGLEATSDVDVFLINDLFTGVLGLLWELLLVCSSRFNWG